MILIYIDRISQDGLHCVLLIFWKHFLANITKIHQQLSLIDHLFRPVNEYKILTKGQGFINWHHNNT